MLPGLPSFEDRDAFLDWTRWHPGHEWISGETLSPALTPPRHDAARQRVKDVLTERLRRQDEPVTLATGPAMRIAAGTGDVLVPDVVVAPEGRIDLDGLVRDPVLVAELISYHTQDRDLTIKLAGYRSIPSLRHILLIDEWRGRCTLASRAGADFRFSFHTCGPLALDAFDLTVDLGDLIELPDAAEGYDHGKAQADHEREKAAGNVEGFTDHPLSDGALPTFASVDDFMAWYEVIPGKQRFELIDGRTRFSRPQQAADFDHSGNFPYMEASQIGSTLAMALGRPDGREWHTFFGGLLTRIDDRTALAPDASVVLHSSKAGDDRFIDPVLVVETLTPETAFIDATAKLAAYARKSGIRHILLVDPLARSVLHFKSDDGALRPTYHASGTIRLDALDAELPLIEIFRD